MISGTSFLKVAIFIYLTPLVEKLEGSKWGHIRIMKILWIIKWMNVSMKKSSKFCSTLTWSFVTFQPVDSDEKTLYF